MKLVDLDEVTNAIDYTDWYHLFKGKLSKGVEDEEHALYKAEDVYKAIGEVPVVDAIPFEWIEEYIFSLNFGIEDEPIGKRMIVKFTIEILDHLMNKFKEEQEKENER